MASSALGSRGVAYTPGSPMCGFLSKIYHISIDFEDLYADIVAALRILTPLSALVFSNLQISHTC